jgi:RNA polymerase sigma-70 factor, ECF subfamily
MAGTTSALAEPGDESSVDLLLKAKSGDDDALDRLLTRYLPRLRRWTSRRLPMALRTLLDSGDLVQEAIISALPRLKTLEIRTERALWVYLKQVVRYRIIDLNKRAHRRPIRREFPEDTPVNGPSPLESAISAEAMSRYRRALETLPREQFRAVVLRVEMGLGYKEIADELGKPSPDAARMTVARAVARLAGKMTDALKNGRAHVICTHSPT